MGRKARLKRYKKEIRAKLQSRGLEDKQFMVVAKTKLVPTISIGKDGKPEVDDKGRPKVTLKKIEKMQARNPLKSLTRRLLRESDATIRLFLGSPDQPSSNQEK